MPTDVQWAGFLAASSLTLAVLAPPRTGNRHRSVFTPSKALSRCMLCLYLVADARSLKEENAICRCSALIPMAIDLLQLATIVLIPAWEQAADLVFALLGTMAGVWLLASGKVPFPVPRWWVVSLSLLTFHLITFTICSLVSLTLTVRWVTYRLGGALIPPLYLANGNHRVNLMLAQISHFMQSTPFPFCADLIVCRLGPGGDDNTTSAASMQVDPAEGLTTLVGLGPSAQSLGLSDTSDTNGAGATLVNTSELGISARATVHPASPLPVIEDSGWGNEVHDLLVLRQDSDEAQEHDQSPFRNSEVGFSRDNSRRRMSTIAALTLGWELLWVLLRQLARLWLVFTWLVVAQRRVFPALSTFSVASMSPSGSFSEREPTSRRAQRQVDMLLMQLARIHEDEAWSSIPFPHLVAGTGRSLRLFWHGRLGETAYELRILQERQVRSEQKQRDEHQLEQLLQPREEELARRATFPPSERHDHQRDSTSGSHVAEEEHVLGQAGPQLCNTAHTSSEQCQMTTKLDADLKGDESVDGRMCVVCMSSPRTIVLWPCRCVNLCEPCRIQMALMKDTSVSGHVLCPTCRATVRGFSRLFFP